jgi:hypothetical protein
MKASSSVAAPRWPRCLPGVSLASTLPACISEMRSQRSASFMKWVEMKMVTRSRATARPAAPEVVARHRVHARGRLVQDQQLGLVHHGHGQRQALAHAQRQAASGRLSASRPAGRSAPPWPARAGAPRLRAHGTAARAAPGSAAPSARHTARTPATCSPRGGAWRCRGSTGCRTARPRPRWRQQAGEHLHGGGLAAAVGAEEAEDLAAADAEADVVDRHEVAKAHGQALRLDGDLAVARAAADLHQPLVAAPRWPRAAGR